MLNWDPQIDLIDDEIKNLLLRRKELVQQVLDYKLKNKLEIYSPDRESEILEFICKDFAEDDPFRPYLSNIFKVLIAENRNFMLGLKK